MGASELVYGTETNAQFSKPVLWFPRGEPGKGGPGAGPLGAAHTHGCRAWLTDQNLLYGTGCLLKSLYLGIREKRTEMTDDGEIDR